jgi:DNA polymerase III subunit alpha
MSLKPFTHLHTHSHYSLLSAVPKIKELISSAKKDGMKSLALTDNGNLYGVIEFYKKCTDEEIKPIIGIDLYVAARTRKDKEGRVDSRRTRLVVLAKNYNGYKNLIELITDANLVGYYYKPRVDHESLQKWSSDLICIVPSFNSELINALRLNDEEKAKHFLDFYNQTYGEENVYLELTHHPEIDGHSELMKNIVNFAKKYNAKLVAAHDVYYLKPEDREARQTLLSVQGTFGGGGLQSPNEDFSFIDTKTANEYFKDFPEALENNQKIVDECNVEIELGKWYFPNIDIPEGVTYDEELRKRTYEGIVKRNLTETQELKERIEYELDIIKTKGYSPYFLAVSDLLKFAKDNGIFANTRGSAAGSMVSYLVGITTVNPIDYELPFERFLNPERPSAPDIDMDFADSRRDEVIEYARKKYGRNAVAQIGTFGTMLARGSVRDVARALGYEYSKGDEIAKLIPMGSQGFPMSIDRALKETPELQEMYDNDEDTKRIIDMAKKIEGCARHISVHAAGVVISPTKLTDFVPLQLDPKDPEKTITQYDMHAVEDAGLLKFDFLGLKNLSIMADTVKLAKKLYNVEIDIDNVPLNDKKTFEMLTRGETVATFQLNGDGMTRFLKELKPTVVDDINAMVALYRPGPMAFIPDYIERKHDPSKVEYFDPKLEPYLNRTYGILIYQDDVLLIAVNLAGYSWGEADKFRKAIGKKIPEEMAKQKEKFTKGCIEIGGFTPENTKKLWEMIETFAAYGFNKAHAASYGRVAYLTSYLKANFPILYMAAVLDADSGDTEKIAEMVAECKRMEIDVLPPNINESFEGFTVTKNSDGKEQIRFGLSTIKNFGEGIAHAIIEERKSGGKFKSLEDFLTRITDRNLNKKSLEALIKSGAMDELGDRSQMYGNLELLLTYNKEIARGPKNQDSLFGDMLSAPPLRLEECEIISSTQQLSWEKELLGLYVSGNPLEQFKEKIEKNSVKISKIKENPPKETVTITVVGTVEEVKIIKTKKGDDMAFVKLADLNDNLECVVFPKLYASHKLILNTDSVLVVEGKVSMRNDIPSLIIDKIKRLC